MRAPAGHTVILFWIRSVSAADLPCASQKCAREEIGQMGLVDKCDLQKGNKHMYFCDDSQFQPDFPLSRDSHAQSLMLPTKLLSCRYFKKALFHLSSCALSLRNEHPQCHGRKAALQPSRLRTPPLPSKQSAHRRRQFVLVIPPSFRPSSLRRGRSPPLRRCVIGRRRRPASCHEGGCVDAPGRFDPVVLV